MQQGIKLVDCSRGKQSVKIPRPKKIKVGGHEYKVVLDDSILLNEQRVGEVDHNNCIIRVHTPLAHDKAVVTFWHETVHAINYVFLDSKLVEADIAGLAEGLYQVLQGMGIEIDWT